MSIPSVLFVTSSDLTPEILIEKVLNSALPKSDRIDENISAYAFPIDNRYYSTTINLCAVSSKSISSEKFSSSVDGVVIVFDGKDVLGLEKAEAWLPYTECYGADIKMLVCNSCAEDESSGIAKKSAQEWCVQKGFELIELESTEEVDPEDDFPETTGVERIRQALHAHQWSNLILKGEPSSYPQALDRPDIQSQGEGFPGPFNETLEELMEGEGDTFSELFAQLADMKEHVGRLSGAAREDAAEKIVRAFWSAMGGEDEDL